MEKKCKAIRPYGSNCDAWAMSDSDYCFTHNPETQADRLLANQKGGKSPKKNLNPLPALALRQTNEIVILLEETINKVRSGELDLKVANTVGFLSGHLLKAIELADLSGRVETIERAILERRVITK
jgi:hypothetical protein